MGNFYSSSHSSKKFVTSFINGNVLEFVKKGEAKPFVYANMFDQYYLYNGEEQFYGSYTNKVQTPEAELNRRRRSIGLPSYGYEQWKFKKLCGNLGPQAI